MPKEFYEEFWMTIKTEKKNYAGEITNKRKNGNLYQAEIRVSPVLDKEGEVEFFVALERDVTEEREMDKAKTEFISLAAHQLRTPLSTISLTTELLIKGIDGQMSKENKKYLKGIHSEVKDMAEMIDIFLNVSRIEMGKFPIETESISLYSVIDDIVSKISPQFKDKKIHFKKDYNKKIPVLNLDQKVMKIILENLLSNAIKYSPNNGKIVLGVEENTNDVIIKVSDNGIGIPLNQQNKIFTKMFRADNVTSIKSEGSGLGLYLVKNLATQSGFDVNFISKENEGTTFIVSIPKGISQIKRKFVGISNTVN
jgi:signal transduction histidine kinase